MTDPVDLTPRGIPALSSPSPYDLPPAPTLDDKIREALQRHVAVQRELEDLIAKKVSLLTHARVLVESVRDALAGAASTGVSAIGAPFLAPVVTRITNKLVDEAVRELDKHNPRPAA